MSTAHAASDGVTAYLTSRAGLNLAGSRGAWLRAAVAQTVGELGDAPGEALRAVEGRAELFGQLCDEVTVQESFFFREPRTLELIRDVVLAGRPADRPVTVWSAGCAGGEEAYTLAVLLADARGAASARVLATDLSPAAAETARRATYGRWSLRGVDDETVARCFTLRREGWQVRDEYRSMVTVEQHNLLDPPPTPAGGFDVILCRNVLIYLTPAAVQRVAAHLADALSPDGWLLTSVSDPLLDEAPGLEAVHTAHGIAYRRSRGASRPEEVEPAAAASATDAGRRVRPAASRLPRPRAGVAPRPAPEGTGRSDRAAALAMAARALELGNPAQAERSAARVLAGGPDVEAQRLLVRALGEQQALAAALVAAEQGIAGFPLDVELRHLHAVLLLESGRYAEAAESARHALYLDHRSPVGHLVLARCHDRLGDAAAAGRGRRNARALIEGRESR